MVPSIPIQNSTPTIVLFVICRQFSGNSMEPVSTRLKLIPFFPLTNILCVTTEDRSGRMIAKCVNSASKRLRSILKLLRGRSFSLIQMA